MRICLTAIFAYSVLTLAAQERYAVDVNNSKVEWSATKVVGGGHNGTVGIDTGYVRIENGAIVEGLFVLDMTTIEVLDLNGAKAKMLQGHLSSKDFFMIKKFPTCTLTVKEQKGNMLRCDLTIKGITNEVSFPVDLGSDDSSLSATANIEVDRTKYDIRFRSQSFFDNLKDKAISDIITYKVVLQANKL